MEHFLDWANELTGVHVLADGSRGVGDPHYEKLVDQTLSKYRRAGFMTACRDAESIRKVFGHPGVSELGRRGLITRMRVVREVMNAGAIACHRAPEDIVDDIHSELD